MRLMVYLFTKEALQRAALEEAKKAKEAKDGPARRLIYKVVLQRAALSTSTCMNVCMCIHCFVCLAALLNRRRARSLVPLSEAQRSGHQLKRLGGGGT